MTEPNQIEINAGHPCISLANKEWPIPPLAIRQLRQLTPIIARYYKRFAAKKGELTQATAIMEFDEELVTDLITIVYIGLTRAHPQITRDEFEDMPISLIELRAAMQTVTKQTGVFAPAATPEKKVEKTAEAEKSIGMQ